MEHRIRVEPNAPENVLPRSKKNQFELIIGGTYESEDVLKAKLLEAISLSDELNESALISASGVQN